MDVLHDERDERAGVKFSDAEIIGAPVTVVCGRDASEGKVELGFPDGRKELVDMNGLLPMVLDALAGKKAEGKNR
jgi:prolyl-tRNA synthetase